MILNLALNDSFTFCEEFSEDMHSLNFDKGLPVRIPHTVKELPFSYLNESDYQMLCAYRLVLDVPTEWQTQSVQINFEGAAHKSILYLNGLPIAEHGCGYTAFTVELDAFLKYGEKNVLVLQLDTREKDVPPFGNVIDYLTYGGIYREVSLKVCAKSFIDDAFVYSQKNDNGEYALSCDTKLVLQDEHVFLNASLLTKSGELVKTFDEVSAISELKFTHEIIGASQWSLETPTLYVLRLQLTKSGALLDEKDIVFGFRTCKFENNGFYLNGKKIKLTGLNRHQSWPYVGYAMPKRAQVLDAKILKNELALNAVRTSHYPQSHHFLNACDEIGLLVFTEIPGWQHIGGESWKKQAIANTKDMVRQYRNHPSIILWGVRINESADDDEFYTATNAAAHSLDHTRQTGGVRCIKNSNLLEDVYTYNDFVHTGDNVALQRKEAVTSNTAKPYLVSEYNGHMYPTKSYDGELVRANHAFRHANVLNEAAKHSNICASFGWCMFDYNTHKDFGSGDKICHHGVLDMFRNHKLAANVYTSQGDSEPFLSISSEMHIGDSPSAALNKIYAFTNADSVKLYCNDVFVNEFFASKKYSSLRHPLICIDDLFGNSLVTREGFKAKTAAQIKQVLISAVANGYGNMPAKDKLLAAYLIAFKGFSVEKGEALYGKYVGNWGAKNTSYRFDAIKNGKIVKSVVKESVLETSLSVKCDTTILQEQGTYDVASIRFCAHDQSNNILFYNFDTVKVEVDGPLEIIGPDCVSLKGGMGGTYVKTIGKTGVATVKLTSTNCKEVILKIEVK